MSALTSIFDFLYVFLFVMFFFIVGGQIFSTSGFFYNNPERLDVLDTIALNIGIPEELVSSGRYSIVFEGEPLLLLILSVFVVGSIIGLTRRLIR